MEVLGFDYYNTRTGQIESGDTSKIAMWMLDTDYDGRSLYPRQVFLILSPLREGIERLARTLKAEIDPELIESYTGTVSLPFEPGKHRRIAVKIVDDRGIESLRILTVNGSGLMRVEAPSKIVIAGSSGGRCQDARTLDRNCTIAIHGRPVSGPSPRFGSPG